ncbi:PKD domain-containing protein [Candidatus Micrarchaeota archaeon]|nr:PKD domain-containing protein [Candidatus Micrarchaeota archaeon]
MRKALVLLLLFGSVLAYSASISPSFGNLGRGTLAFTCSGTDFTPYKYDWSWQNGTGAWQQVNNWRGNTWSYNFSSLGTYHIKCNALAYPYGGASATATLYIINYKPFVYVTGGKQLLLPGNATINATGRDPDGRIVNYTINWGDGSPLETTIVNNKTFGFSQSHRFAHTGTYKVNVSAVDNDKGSGYGTTIITVSNEKPNARPASVDCTEAGLDSNNCLFDASDTSDPDNDALQVIFYINRKPGGGCLQDYDCVTLILPRGEKTGRKLMAARGNHTVWVYASDGKAAGSAVSTETNFTVPNPPPIALFDAPAPECKKGVDCSFNGSASYDDAQGSVDSYSWDFGDGDTSAEAAPQHEYTSGGDFNVTLTVTDNEGATGSLTRTIHVLALKADQSTGDSFASYVNVGYAYDRSAVAQEFVPASQVVDEVGIFAGSSNGGVEVKIRDSLDGADLWKDTLNGSMLENDTGFTRVPVNESLVLTAGRTYYIIIEPVALNGAYDNLRAYYVSPGNYDAGAPWVNNSTAWNAEAFNRDFLFETRFWG